MDHLFNPRIWMDPWFCPRIKPCFQNQPIIDCCFQPRIGSCFHLELVHGFTSKYVWKYGFLLKNSRHVSRILINTLHMFFMYLVELGYFIQRVQYVWHFKNILYMFKSLLFAEKSRTSRILMSSLHMFSSVSSRLFYWNLKYHMSGTLEHVAYVWKCGFLLKNSRWPGFW